MDPRRRTIGSWEAIEADEEELNPSEVVEEDWDGYRAVDIDADEPFFLVHI